MVDNIKSQSGSDKFFIVALTPAATGVPGMWLGTCTRDEYDHWFKHNHALLIEDSRGLAVQMQDNRPAMLIVPPYIGDTPQRQIALHPFSVEIVGLIEADEQGTPHCSGNNMLYQAYSDAISRARAASSNLTLAGPADLKALKNNITQFPTRK